MALPTSTAKRLFSVAFQIRSYSAPAERSIPTAKQRFVPSSGTYPKGFLVGSAHAGVKPSNTKYDDIALVVSEELCPAKAVFTRNIFKAAPVEISKEILDYSDRSDIRGVIINSGCANAVTGSLGKQHAREMAEVTDQCFNSRSPNKEDLPHTMVMSTGVIGQRLPIDRIKAAIPKAHAALGSNHEHWMRAAQAICTTDSFPKLLSRTFTLPSHPETEYRIAGMTKGAGMIHPNMGTLLAVVCTDASIESGTMKRMLVGATNRSFNQISIDGDTSTNDTVAFFANGAATPANVEPLRASTRTTESAAESSDREAFFKVLRRFMTDLAKLVVRDGEGATKFVTIRVQSAMSHTTANRVASSIATSSLVKTALYGKDANWGRILCAIGYAPGIMTNKNIGIHSDNRDQVTPSRTSVSFVPTDGSEELKLLVRGEPEQVDEERAKEILEMEDLEILVRLDDMGDESDAPVADGKNMFESRFYTCDFSHEYVTINGDYRT